jgi:hypothetical protein
VLASSRGSTWPEADKGVLFRPKDTPQLPAKVARVLLAVTAGLEGGEGTTLVVTVEPSECPSELRGDRDWRWREVVRRRGMFFGIYSEMESPGEGVALSADPEALSPEVGEERKGCSDMAVVAAALIEACDAPEVVPTPMGILAPAIDNRDA